MNELSPSVEFEALRREAIPVVEKLDRARRQLLDLSARNRLLNVPSSGRSTRMVEFAGIPLGEVYRALIGGGRGLRFAASESAKSLAASGSARPATGALLTTDLEPEALLKRLRQIYFDARTIEEEQGVNVLYLALGLLAWVDPRKPDARRCAPLLLVPVAIERGSTLDRYRLTWRQEDLAPNLSLEVFAKQEHDITLPSLADDEDDADVESYLLQVAEAVKGKAGWEVLFDSAILGFFSFAKFLMYRDLDPSAWPDARPLEARPMLRPLLDERGFAIAAPTSLTEAESSERNHVENADHSQREAIGRVFAGQSVIIEGPPGTGKSQTITNIIAEAVLAKKRVLFAAEKLAALEVVKRNLDRLGLGAACLELHSNKAKKKDVLGELDRTWRAAAPSRPSEPPPDARLEAVRKILDGHATLMSAPLGPGGWTPFEVVGRIARLRGNGQAPSSLQLGPAHEWPRSRFEERRSLARELVDRLQRMGPLQKHPWFGSRLQEILPLDLQRRAAQVEDLAKLANSFQEVTAELARSVEEGLPRHIADADAHLALAGRLLGAPELVPEALANPAWDTSIDELDRVIRAGARLAKARAAVGNLFSKLAWEADVAPVAEVLARHLPPSFALVELAKTDSLMVTLARLRGVVAELADTLGTPSPQNLPDVERTVAIAERVAAAPDVNPDAFLSELWRTGVERANDLVQALVALNVARSAVSGVFADAAWDVDLSGERRTIASRRGSPWRFLSRQWWRTRRTVRSLLVAQLPTDDELVALLDRLAQGQRATRALDRDAEFGASCFASEWRGPKSSVERLQLLVDWMRSLGSQGDEPRRIASANPDRSSLQRLSGQVLSVADEARAALQDLSRAGEKFLPRCQPLATCGLETLLDSLRELSEAGRGLRSLFTEMPSDWQAALAALEELTLGQRAIAYVQLRSETARAAFGSAWAGASSDWRALWRALEWVRQNSNLRLLASRVSSREGLRTQLVEMPRQRDQLLEAFDHLLTSLDYDRALLAPEGDLRQVSLQRLSYILALWREKSESLTELTAYNRVAHLARSEGLGPFVDQLEDNKLELSRALADLEMAYFEAVYKDQVERDPRIRYFDGDRHSRLVDEYQELEERRRAWALFETRLAHYEGLPPRHGGAYGTLGVLKAEMAKQRRHLPVRRLMERAGEAVQAIKPVLLMSPLSVAQFLPPGTVEFDLLVMDEASQISPVDGFGAVARARQVVVVGDTKQLPPTAFFNKLTSGDNSDEELDDDEIIRVAEIESILTLFGAAGLPSATLDRHYRSRHESLIAVSNSHFYEQRLHVIPSPLGLDSSHLGLSLERVKGYYDAGGRRDNSTEADRVVSAVKRHARSSAHLSLGIATFSVSQRECIRLRIEEEVKNDEDLKRFVESHPTEPFFVKNLENVQGDERDVIFVSVGYGPTHEGAKPAMRFGPLNKAGGERRLNVLITRAKWRCVVFSSLGHEDIPEPLALKNPGIRAFRTFLEYARERRLPAVSARDTMDSRHPLVHEEICRALARHGHEVKLQVGEAGFTIDLAVRDPNGPGRYVLGIELDGPTYTRSSFTRERDLLRRKVLADHDWHLHRVWALDWLARPQQQLQSLLAAIDASATGSPTGVGRSSRAHSRSTEKVPAPALQPEPSPGTPGHEGGDAPFSRPYVCANLGPLPANRPELHEARPASLVPLVEMVVDAEGPVHVDEVVARVREAWGLQRSGSRIRAVFEVPIERLIREQRLGRDGDFLFVPKAPVVVRDRSAAPSPGLRRPEMLPVSELRAAATMLARVHLGCERDDLIQAVSRALGFKATSAQLRDCIGGAIDLALQAGELEQRGDLLVAAAE